MVHEGSQQVYNLQWLCPIWTCNISLLWVSTVDLYSYLINGKVSDWHNKYLSVEEIALIPWSRGRQSNPLHFGEIWYSALAKTNWSVVTANQFWREATIEYVQYLYVRNGHKEKISYPARRIGILIKAKLLTPSGHACNKRIMRMNPAIKLLCGFSSA